MELSRLNLVWSKTERLTLAVLANTASAWLRF